MKRGTLKKRDLAKSNPIAKAISLAQMRHHLTTIGLHIYTRADGEPSQDLLAHLGWLIGIGAEIAANVEPGQPQAKALHGALRSVVDMSAKGGAWNAAIAPALHDAAHAAKELLVKHPHVGLRFVASGDHLASRIASGKATLNDVAGAEIYQQAERA